MRRWKGRRRCRGRKGKGGKTMIGGGYGQKAWEQGGGEVNRGTRAYRPAYKCESMRRGEGTSRAPTRSPIVGRRRRKGGGRRGMEGTAWRGWGEG